MRAQLKPLWIFVIAGVAILLANIFFNKENAVSAGLVSLGSVKVTGPALWAAGTLWLRLLAFALLSLVFIKTTEPQRPHPQPGPSAPSELSGGLRDHGGLSHAAAVPDGLPDHPRGAEGARGAGARPAFCTCGRATRRYALPLLAGAVRKAGRVALAMDARAFGAFPEPHLSRANGRAAFGLGLRGRVVRSWCAAA